MRPDVLIPLFSDSKTLPGVGSKLRELLGGVGLTRVKDLLLHFPYGVIDRRNMPDLVRVPDGQIITTIVTVEQYHEPQRRSAPFKVICTNASGTLTLVFFHATMQSIATRLPLGEQRVISGKVERFDGMLQMVHPEYVGRVQELASIQRMEPIYRLTAGITQRTMGKIIGAATERIPDLLEWIEPNYLKARGWQSWKKAMQQVHHTESNDDVQPTALARMRLAYDELLANQLALALTRTRVRKQQGRALQGDGELRAQLRKALPFTLTQGQEQVLKEITQDMADPHRMLRLLQGDVGSGKTVLALLSILSAVECGMQAALMAPTEILARQHGVWIEAMLARADLSDKVQVVVLTGQLKGKKREEALQALADGRMSLAVGTHALFQESVVFKDLALVVIDEQHRFGVQQRLTLAGKGNRTDILLMTATPIPRTLTLTLYGDMEVSVLQEKPAGRLPITTRTISMQRIKDVVEGLKRTTAEGSRVYWVCPLIEETEESDLTAAQERFTTLKKYFGERVGIVHGKMKSEQKDAVMQSFISGTLDVLVATTVIEVGVNVPEATVMVIEHAERFGLSQLHQLRGRVGRSDTQSSCLLLYDNALSETARKRLKVLRETEDGFRIAEEDLLLRGSGEVLGTKQSGMPDFQLAVFPEHNELLLAARDDVKMILQQETMEKSERGTDLRTLLYLFEYDEQVRYLMSG